MNRSKLKTYAPQARRDFIQAVTDRAALYGLTPDMKNEPITVQGDVAIIGGKPFPLSVAAKRKRLEDRIQSQSFAQVMEAMAYTWFNRLVAIRYMEIHGYLDHGYRVLSNSKDDPEHGKFFAPQIVEQAEHVSFPGVQFDKQKVVELKLDGTQDNQLYRLLLLAQCNALHAAMPFFFERIDDETELLLPDNLLHSDSIIRKLVSEIDEADWQQVEIIGWLYQFYISEKKDEVIGKVVKSEDIPAATQLFTPNWIVKYLVHNSLGRQWLATYPESPLRTKMEYYIEPAQQTPQVQAQLKAITPESLNPEQLTLLDPACGSGHILVEAYDTLKAIYLERGYRARDIPEKILRHNLFGLEIDPRAAQLASFALLMKARADDPRIFSRGDASTGGGPWLNIRCILSSDAIDAQAVYEMLAGMEPEDDQPGVGDGSFGFMEEIHAPLLAEARNTRTQQRLAATGQIDPGFTVDHIRLLLSLFTGEQAQTFGSLIRIPETLADKLPAMVERADRIRHAGDVHRSPLAERFFAIAEQASILAGHYDAVVANPPYMGSKGQNATIKKFLKDEYPDVKSDLFSAFIVRNLELANDHGQLGIMCPFVWMFISSYEKLRKKLLDGHHLTSLIQLEYSGFDGATVPICTFTAGRAYLKDYTGSFIRLTDFRGAKYQSPKALEAIQNPDCGWFHTCRQSDFHKIPGSPIVYWISDSYRELYRRYGLVRDLFFSDGLTKTGDNEKFLRLWWEVNHSSSRDHTQYRTCVKGGDARSFYGNTNSLVVWTSEARQHYRNDNVARITPEYLWERCGISWTKISSRGPTFRWFGGGMIAETGGPAIFAKDDVSEELLFLCLGFLESSVAWNLLSAINPTLNFQTNDVLNLPLGCEVSAGVSSAAKILVEVHKSDWDSYETSWDFTTNPIVRQGKKTLAEAYAAWREQCRADTARMKALEEENNRLFIEAYGLQAELSPQVPIEQITLFANPAYRYPARREQGEETSTPRPAEELESAFCQDTLRELVSYALGCMMGRYSLDKPGLIYAHSGNQGFDPSQYKTFPADPDGIIPITEIDWFMDDATHRLEEFVGVAWPKEHLEENLKFVARSLAPASKNGEEARDTIRRYFADDFYKHHLQTYKRRPIYWLFSSGKLGAFQCLVYLHRYHEGTLARMRTEYVIPLQGKINAQLEKLEGKSSANTPLSQSKDVQRVGGDIEAASGSYKKKLEKHAAQLRLHLKELQKFDEKLRHYADQRIKLELDDGVKVNYGKFGDLLACVSQVCGKGEDEE